jgi:hypothetical protein
MGTRKGGGGVDIGRGSANVGGLGYNTTASVRFEDNMVELMYGGCEYEFYSGCWSSVGRKDRSLVADLFQ